MSIRTLAGILVLSCFLLSSAAYGVVFIKYSVDGWHRYVPLSEEEGPAEAAIKEVFLSNSKTVEERYEALFGYFAGGALEYLSQEDARINYPGIGSKHGYRVNGLEGFARTGTLLAAWVDSGRGDVVVEGRSVDLVALLRHVLLTGTDPRSAAYWGRIRDRDLRIVEAADIARILWMTREQIWDRLDEADKAQLADWLLQVTSVETHPNNWMLFPVTVTVALRALGWQVSFDEKHLYERFKRHYLGNGWFYDMPGVVDYYNAWGISYELFWITAIDGRFDRAFIRNLIKDSADLTSHLIGPRGFPVMGRSICYRTAVPAPLAAQALLNPSPGSAGLARRATDAIWRYFVARGSLQDGALTQGFFRSDPALLDYYSGAGSCHWGLRSLILAFLNPRGSDFWTVPEVPLPVEVADYRLDYEALGWIVEGDKASGEITIEIPKNDVNVKALERYGWWRRLSEMALQRPNRPHNRAAKYGRRKYSSAKPFWEE